ncbi:type 1 glutamine amidotransferase [Ideonella azotifigens]|uniref:GMP synthase n=1 Tax=Ideonella azotifigens TaxID=513160 RepID=A0ABN1KG38_9BURK|nr:type 1 glutamine amidotransferase [Ideonella azotifigens]MCD2340525.1 type 1 glutamine amidotransferase [Ideonella azotifigens]
MKPVALLQHDKTQRPGFLLDYLEEVGIEHRLICPEQGDSLPRDPRDFSGIVMLGSNRSVNEPLPWIHDELALAQAALRADIPLLGHCFGGQMIAKAMGARVSTNAWANIGWNHLQVTPAGRRLFGEQPVVAFNWHYDTFEIPAGAQRLLFGRHCLNKAFGMGKHLAFQCHFEVTEAIVREWCHESALELAHAAGPAAQSREEILRQLKTCLPQLHASARHIYRHWVASLPRPVVAHMRGGW